MLPYLIQRWTKMEIYVVYVQGQKNGPLPKIGSAIFLSCFLLSDNPPDIQGNCCVHYVNVSIFPVDNVLSFAIPFM